MRHLIRWACFLIVLAALMFPLQYVAAAPGGQPSGARLSREMQQIIALINQRRAEAGIAPVYVNGVLMACAQQYSQVQAAQGSINHTGPDGSTPGQRLRRCGYNWRHFGENLAAGYVDPNELVAAWMASPGHRKNILNPKVREIGLGYTHRADDPGYYYDYYVMLVGVRR